MKKVRYVFESDDEGHCYIVPLSQRKRFRATLETGYATDDFSTFEKEFGNTRCSGSHCISFTDPKEIE